MKTLVLFLIITISIQPVQAGFCDMESGQSAAHHQDASHDMESGHDEGGPCCDSAQPESTQDCDSDMQCGFCAAGVSAVFATQKVDLMHLIHNSGHLSSGVVTSSHSHPPFRPPII
jgi:hypothetical protein